tara:strand:+ start:1758 stop:2045 length:288 start_codon:yes stop_codon:yes gene_type:complete
MSKENKTEEMETDPVVITIAGEGGNARSWKRSECNEHQLELIRELEPIGHDLLAITKKFNEINRNKQYRVEDFIAASKEEVVVDNPEQNPITEKE